MGIPLTHVTPMIRECWVHHGTSSVAQIRFARLATKFYDGKRDTPWRTLTKRTQRASKGYPFHSFKRHPSRRPHFCPARALGALELGRACRVSSVRESPVGVQGRLESLWRDALFDLRIPRPTGQ
jgi:hypothetical protein